MVTGLLIVFEGIDGSGTTTQAALLHDWLLRCGRRAVLTSEPTSGPVGSLIRQVMTGRLTFSGEADHFDRFLAHLFAADRYDHVYNETDGVQKWRNEGVDVVSTRYYFSSLAYHADNEQARCRVAQLNDGFPEPDVTIYLDCPVDLALHRLRRARQFTEHYENPKKLNVVKHNYDEVFRDFHGMLLRIDASSDRDQQQAIVRDQVRMVLMRRGIVLA